MRTKLEIIESEAIAMDKERNTKKEEIHKEEWILNNPTVSRNFQFYILF